METKLIPAVLFAMLIVISCREENEDKAQNRLGEELKTEDNAINIDSTFQACDSVFIATHYGTACCMSGPTQAKPNEIATYHYQINHKDPEMNWEIREGDITILSGQDAPTVTVQFGPSFTTGVIGCVGSGVKEGFRLKCSDRCIVRNQL